MQTALQCAQTSWEISPAALFSLVQMQWIPAPGIQTSASRCRGVATHWGTAATTLASGELSPEGDHVGLLLWTEEDRISNLHQWKAVGLKTCQQVMLKISISSLG